jgi:uncharacterized protein (TIGR03083 family)
VPTTLTPDQHLAALRDAVSAFARHAQQAGLDVPVPTCPDWTVRRLIGHQGMVHRWAASQLRGAPIDPPEPLEAEGRASADVLGWFVEGATDLLQAIVDAPDDLEALVFLEHAPPARLFWTRRQCHETTIHAVDALGARLRRPARADETWISPEVAVDGIDELLVGFITRSRKGASPDGSTDPTRLLVHPDGCDVAWLVDLAAGRPIETRRVRPDAVDVSERDHEWRGGPVDLYLRLWSRCASDPVDDLERWWRETISVTW